MVYFASSRMVNGASTIDIDAHCDSCFARRHYEDGDLGRHRRQDFIPEAPPEPEGDHALLNGLKVKGDEGHPSQNVIAALFP